MIVIVCYVIGGFCLGFLGGVIFIRSSFSKIKTNYESELSDIRKSHLDTINYQQSQAVERDQLQLAHFRKEINKLAVEESLILSEMPSADQLN